MNATLEKPKKGKVVASISNAKTIDDFNALAREMFTHSWATFLAELGRLVEQARKTLSGEDYEKWKKGLNHEVGIKESDIEASIRIHKEEIPSSIFRPDIATVKILNLSKHEIEVLKNDDEVPIIGKDGKPRKQKPSTMTAAEINQVIGRKGFKSPSQQKVASSTSGGPDTIFVSKFSPTLDQLPNLEGYHNKSRVVILLNDLKEHLRLNGLYEEFMDFMETE